MTAADELRQAAAKVRDTHATLAETKDIRGQLDLTEWGEWFGPDDIINLAEVNAWIALMSPALAEPLAAWLEGCAGQAEAMRHNAEFAVCDEPGSVQAALKVARAINGGAS